MDEAKCVDCGDWFGCCLSGKREKRLRIGRVASSDACSKFKPPNLNPVEAKIRLNWGSPETPELVPSDLIHAAQLGLIRPEEFRKNAVKFGWELWDAPKGHEGSKASQEVSA